MNLTVPELAAALRVDVSGGAGDFDPADFDPADFDTDTDPQVIEVTRLLAFVSAAVLKAAPAAPPQVANEAAIRLAGWLFDATLSARGARDPLRASGAWSLLACYHGRPVETGRAFSGAFGAGFN